MSIFKVAVADRMAIVMSGNAVYAKRQLVMMVPDIGVVRIVVEFGNDLTGGF